MAEFISTIMLPVAFCSGAVLLATQLKWLRRYVEGAYWQGPVQESQRVTLPSPGTITLEYDAGRLFTFRRPFWRKDGYRFFLSDTTGNYHEIATPTRFAVPTRIAGTERYQVAHFTIPKAGEYILTIEGWEPGHALEESTFLLSPKVSYVGILGHMLAIFVGSIMVLGSALAAFNAVGHA